MSLEIPSDFGPFVERMISERRFLSESDVVAEGLRLLHAREELRRELQTGFDQLDAGLGVPADQAYAQAEACIDAIEAQQKQSGQ